MGSTISGTEVTIFSWTRAPTSSSYHRRSCRTRCTTRLALRLRWQATTHGQPGVVSATQLMGHRSNVAFEMGWRSFPHTLPTAACVYPLLPQVTVFPGSIWSWRRHRPLVLVSVSAELRSAACNNNKLGPTL